MWNISKQQLYFYNNKLHVDISAIIIEFYNCIKFQFFLYTYITLLLWNIAIKADLLNEKADSFRKMLLVE